MNKLNGSHFLMPLLAFCVTFSSLAQSSVSSLSISRAPNERVELRWPAATGNAAMEMAPNLPASSGWLPVTDTPLLIGNQFSLFLPANGLRQFYRLNFADPDGDPSSAPDHLVINEILFSTAGPAGTPSSSQWIELLNPASTALELGGWMITDGHGSFLIDLAGWTVPSHSLLVVAFEKGEHDRDFTDGVGTLRVDLPRRAFDPQRGEIGLFKGPPAAATLIDFVVWSAEPTPNFGTLYQLAVAAGLWTSGDFVDLRHQSGGGIVLPGESIGRDSIASDSNSSQDFSTHGGHDSFILSRGTLNHTLLVVPDWFLSRKLPAAHANWMLNKNGYRVMHAAIYGERLVQTNREIRALAEHVFITERHGRVNAVFSGASTTIWQTDSAGTLTQAVEITIRERNAPASAAMRSAFFRTSHRDKLNVRSHTRWTASFADSNQPFFDWEQDLQSRLEGNGRYVTTGSSRIFPGLGSPSVVIQYQRTEELISHESVSGHTTATLQTGSQTAQLDARYRRRTFEDLAAYEFLYGSGPLIEGNASYTSFDLRKNGKLFQLAVVPSATAITKTTPDPGYQGTFNYNWNLPLLSSDGARITLGLAGTMELLGQFVKINFTDSTGDIFQMVVDPEPDPAIGFWLKVIAAVVGVIGTGVTINEALEDDTPPEVTFEFGSVDCDAEKGFTPVKVIVTDDDDGVAVTSFDLDLDEPPAGVTHIGAVLASSSGSEPMTATWTDTLYNRTESDKAVAITVLVQDKAGNTKVTRFPTVFVMGRCPPERFKTDSVTDPPIPPPVVTPPVVTPPVVTPSDTTPPQIKIEVGDASCGPLVGERVLYVDATDAGGWPDNVSLTPSFVGNATVHVSQGSARDPSLRIWGLVFRNDTGVDVTVTLTLSLQDRAGNTGTGASTFTVPGRCPTQGAMRLQAPETGSILPGNDARVAVAITGGSAPYVIAFASPWQAETLQTREAVAQLVLTVPSGTGAGTYGISIAALDSVGNHATAKSSLSVLPMTAPIVTRSSAFDFATPGQEVKITGLIEGGTPPYTVLFKSPWAIEAIDSSVPSYEFFVAVPFNATAGAYQYLLLIRDQTGQILSQERSFSVMLEPPTRPMDAVLSIPDSVPRGVDMPISLAITGGTAPYTVTLNFAWGKQSVVAETGSMESTVRIPTEAPLGVLSYSIELTDSQNQTFFIPGTVTILEP